MPKRSIVAEQVLAVSRRLGDAAIDPAIWPEIMEGISAAVGATGAALLQSDVRTSDIPRTAGAHELIEAYFSDAWHLRDIRAQRGVPLQLRGQKVVTDQDILTPEEIQKSDMYNELFAPLNFKWWAAVGFWSGSAPWALSIQRAPQEGPFEQDEKHALGSISQRLTETATLSKTVGKAVLSGMTNALHLVSQPALALDRFGFVLDMNAAIEPVLDGEINVRNRRLYLYDKQARSLLDRLIDQMRTTPDASALFASPIAVQRRAKPPLVIRVLPVDGGARTPFPRCAGTAASYRFRPQVASAIGNAGGDVRLVASGDSACLHRRQRSLDRTGGRRVGHHARDGAQSVEGGFRQNGHAPARRAGRIAGASLNL